MTHLGKGRSPLPKAPVQPKLQSQFMLLNSFSAVGTTPQSGLGCPQQWKKGGKPPSSSGLYRQLLPGGGKRGLIAQQDPSRVIGCERQGNKAAAWTAGGGAAGDPAKSAHSPSACGQEHPRLHAGFQEWSPRKGGPGLGRQRAQGPGRAWVRRTPPLPQTPAAENEVISPSQPPPQMPASPLSCALPYQLGPQPWEGG